MITLNDKDAAVEMAQRLSRTTGRAYATRDTGSVRGRFIVVPMYDDGREGYQHDAGYAALGSLVWWQGKQGVTLRP